MNQRRDSSQSPDEAISMYPMRAIRGERQSVLRANAAISTSISVYRTLNVHALKGLEHLISLTAEHHLLPLANAARFAPQLPSYIHDVRAGWRFATTQDD